MLEVVEQDQELLAPQETVELVARPDRRATSDHTSCGSERLASGTQKTPSRSVPIQLGCDLERETSLSSVPDLDR